MATKRLGTVVCLLALAGLMTGAALAADEEVPFVEGKKPPKAEDGHAWCLVVKPATFKTVTEKVEVSPATHYMETIPAVYEPREKQMLVAPAKKKAVYVPAEWKTEEVRQLVQEASFTYEVIPPEYEWVEQQVVVVPEYEEATWTPAVYKTVTDTVVVAPARTVTKKVKCDGDLDCYTDVEIPEETRTISREVLTEDAKQGKRKVPAVTKTIRVRKVKTPAQAKKVEIPAKYDTYTRKVLVTPPSFKVEEVPAQFCTITEMVEVKPASTQKVEVPAKYETVTRRVLDQPSRTVWRKVRTNRCKEVASIVEKYESVPASAVAYE